VLVLKDYGVGFEGREGAGSKGEGGFRMMKQCFWMMNRSVYIIKVYYFGIKCH
jgi:hypothetical protein